MGGSVGPIGDLPPYILSYVFTCRLCSASGQERFHRTQVTWRDILLTALANLSVDAALEHGSVTPSDAFFPRKAIARYIERQWRVLCVGKGMGGSWIATIGNYLATHPDEFEAEAPGRSNYRLRNRNLNELRPVAAAPLFVPAAPAKRKGDAVGTAVALDGATAVADPAAGAGGKRARTRMAREPAPASRCVAARGPEGASADGGLNAVLRGAQLGASGGVRPSVQSKPLPLSAR